MSGLFTPRVNRSWGKDQANICAAVFFWEWLKYFEAHNGFDFVSYGTGKVLGGAGDPPAAWKDWKPHAPDLEAVPMGDNSWFVVEAKNADAQLDGGGSHPWQIKLQMTLATGFDDCNVADNNYGFETQTYCVAIRANAMGGFDNVSLDFVPVGGEESSDNYLMFYGQDENFYLDIVGDDDTVFWKGSAFDTTEYLSQSRSGYVGMLQRRSAAIANPFFMKIGRISDQGSGAGELNINNRSLSNANAEWQADGYWNYGVGWPSYSVWSDGTRVTTHHQDCWDFQSLPDVTKHPVSGDDIVPAMLVSQKQAPAHHAIIGEYRFIGATFTRYAQHTLFGDNQEWIEICYASTTYGGVAMRWPDGVVPIW